MALKPFIAEKGLMTQVLGSASTLAVAAPLVDGDRDETALTDASRIGFYWDRTASAEKIGFLVLGTETLSITPTGISTPSLTVTTALALPAGSVALTSIATIANNRILGNNSGGTASPSALTGTQATALLDVFTTSLKGLAPASGGGTSNFLRADGTWAAPFGTIGGSITVNQVAIGSGTNTISGSAGLTVVSGVLTSTSYFDFNYSDNTDRLARIQNYFGGTTSRAGIEVVGAFGYSSRVYLTSDTYAALPALTTVYEVSGTRAIFSCVGVTTAANRFLDANHTAGTVVSGSVYAWTFGGTVTGSNLSGTNTGDQTITLTGNVTGSGTGSFATTIAANVVTDAMLAQVATATFKGRITAGTGNLEVLTGTQATTLLDVFTTSLKGLAPASGGGASNFLRADGTWAVPAGTTVPGGSNTHVQFNDSSAFGGVANFTFNKLTGAMGLSQVLQTTGNPTFFTLTGAAHTTMTASTETVDVSVGLNRTVQWATGAITNQRFMRILAPTTSFVAASTITFASTLAISGAPAAGTNATHTASAALNIEGGNVWIGTMGGTFSNTSGRLILASGSVTLPGLTFCEQANATGDTGLYGIADGSMGVTTNGTLRLTISTTAFTGTLPWLGQNGTAAAPALSFSGDTNCGIYNIGADQIGFTTNGTLRFAINTAASAVGFDWTQGVAATASPIGWRFTGAAHTTLTLSVEASDVFFNLARTVQFATGALTTQRAIRIAAPTYAFVGASVITSAATVAITGAPVAGTNATITSSYALWVQAGVTQLDGGLSVTGTITATSTVTGSNLSGTNTGDQTITLTGDVTGSGTGSFAATIANSAVTLAKQANVAFGTVFYRKTAGAGAPEVQTLATLKTDLGLTGTNSGDQTITLTGDVTGSGTGSFATTIANSAVTLAKMADVATATFLGRTTAATGVVEALTIAQAKALLNLTGTNSGDQTITLTGDVTGSGTGSFAATIANSSVTLAKMANVATGTVFYRTTAGAGAPEVQTLATLKTDLGLTGTNSGDQTITLTGDVTGSGVGSFAATIAANAVTLAKFQQIATGSLLGRSTAATGNVEVITVGAGLTLSGGTLTATNTGTVTSVSVVTANGVSGSVATATTTPAITLTLGAITPTSVAASGTVTGSNLSGTNSGDQTITLTGDVTGSGTGSFATTIASNTVSLAKMAQIATASLLGRSTAATGNVEVIAVSTGLTISGGTIVVAYGATSTTACVGNDSRLSDARTPTAHVLDSATHTISGKTAGQVLLATAATTYAFTAISGDATLSGAGALTVVNSAVTLAKQANVASGTVFYRTTAGAGAPEVQTLATLKTDLGLTGTNSGDQTITLTGNVTGSGTGSFTTTIAANAVTDAMLAQVATATFKGRVTAATGNVETLTGTQATTLLDVFTTALKGLAPASGGGAVNFLRADGTWAVPAGTTPPAGANTQVQFNDAGVFGGSAGLVFDKTSKVLSIINNAVAASAYLAGTLLSVEGADGVNTRMVLDTHGTGVFSAYNGRLARGTAALPTAIQLGDEMLHVGGRGYGTTAYSTSVRGYFSIFAAENWTDTAQGTRVGIFTTAPGTTTTVEGVRVWGDGGMSINAFTASLGKGSLDIAQGVQTTGSPTGLRFTGGAHTTLTASVEAVDVDFSLNRTVQFATGALATQRAAVLRAPTYAFVAASTVTVAATLSITGAPIAGTNATLTNARALWIESGRSHFDGQVVMTLGAQAPVNTTPTLMLTRSTDGYVFIVEAPNMTGTPAFSLQNLPLSTDLNTGKGFELKVTGEAAGRAMFYSDGKYAVGSGAGSRDTVLSRSAANTFRITTDGASGAGHLEVMGRTSVGVALSATTTALITQAVATSGTPSLAVWNGGAHTTLATTVEAVDVDINLARTVQWATGAIATQRAFLVRAPTYGFVAASVVTNAATVAITGAPVAGTNATLTNSYALWVQAGVTKLDGGLSVTGTIAATSTVTGSNLSGTNTGDQTITLTGNVTGSGTGSFVTTIAASAVTLAMMANVATATVFYRKTAGTGAPEVQTLATLKTDLGLTGTNSGDQTITLTGNVTGSGTGSFATTIAANVVTNAMLAQVATATFQGRVTAATGNVETLTGTQATTLLDVFTTALKGLAPASGGGTANFLRADGTWNVPAGTFSGSLANTQVAIGSAANTISGSAQVVYSSSTFTVTPTTAVNTGYYLTGSLNDFLQYDIKGTSNGTAACSGYSATADTGTATTGFMWTGINNSTFALVNAYSIGGPLDTVVLGSGNDLYLANAHNTKDTIFSLGRAATPFFDEFMRIKRSVNGVTITQPVSTSGTPTAFAVTGGVHTTLAASVESTDINFNLARTVQFATGAITTQRAVLIQAPTYAFVLASTITNAATLAIANAPQVGTNATLTNSYALWVQAGLTKLAGSLDVTGTIVASSNISTGTTGTGTGGSVRYISDANTLQWNVGILGPFATNLVIQNVVSTRTILTLSASTDTVTISGPGVVSPTAVTTGVQTALLVTGAANTGLTASTEVSDINFNLARTVQWATGALATQRAVRIQAPTYAFVAASTITTAATLSITGAPIAGTNATLTNSYALYVESGTAQFGGNVTVVGNLAVSGTTTHTGATTFNGTATFNNKVTGTMNDGTLASCGIVLVQAAAAGGGVGTAMLKLTGGAHTGLPASTELNQVNFAFNQTVQFATGALATQRCVLIQAPTYAFVAASTLTTAATFAITGSPVAGTNATITNSYALWVQGGTSLFAGLINGASGATFGSSTTGTVTFNYTTVFSASVSGTIANSGGAANAPQGIVLIQAAGSGGTGATAFFSLTGGAHTGQTASTELNAVSLNFAQTVQFATGAITTQRAIRIQAPTYAFVAASTITTAATVAISGAPIAGTNATLTATYALWVQGGTSRFDGAVDCAGNTLTSGKYLLGTDLSLIPIVGNQSAITTWWGMQLVGNKQSNIDYTPAAIGAAGDFSVIIPNQQAASIGLIIKGQTSQSGNLLQLNNVSNTGLSAFNSAGRLGIGIVAPTSELHVVQAVATTGSPTGVLVTGAAHTTLTLSVEAIDVNFNLARVVQFATGALATQRAFLVQAPTYAFVAASTLTSAATFAITGAPIAGTNATLTNTYALWVQAGTARFDGAVLSAHATAGIGYATGAGGTVTQATSKATAVTLSKACGTITLNAASLASVTSVAFTLTNTAIAASDLVVCVHDSVGTLGGYSVVVTPGAGSATVTVRNMTAGALAEAIVLRFAVIKAVTA